MRTRLLALFTAALLLTPAVSHSGEADHGFTIAVIPDTQNYLDYTHQKSEGFPFDASELFLAQMRYVAANARSAGGDIAFLTALGDVWQHQSLAIDPAHAARGFERVANPFLDGHFAPTARTQDFEMPLARKGYAFIDGKMPFAVVPGNHDHDAMWTDANHPPAAQFTGLNSLGMSHAGGTSNFVSVFGAESDFFRGKNWYVDSFAGGADSAQVFEAGGYRFLHIGLQFDAPDAALAWASGVVKRHAGLPTIVTIHGYLNNEGERAANPMLDNSAIDPEDNSPQMVWDEFISQHDQIFLVLCGHHHGQSRRVDANRFGHSVHQVLADYQDRAQTLISAGRTPERGEGVGDGWLRLMRFDMGAEPPRIDVKTVSTHYGRNSSELPEYAAWYRAAEKPAMDDAGFLAQDAFTLELGDFRKRFGRPAGPSPAASAGVDVR